VRVLLALGPLRRGARRGSPVSLHAIQSSYGRRLAQALGINPEDPDTNAVVHDGIACFKSDAALMALSHLPDGDGCACFV
jgi:predicted DCC family thiol-disulfide oxidoreductase YuxK